jgi:arylsulfatase A-like enzyme
VDVAPTVLHLLGMPVPGNMDGHVISQAFTQESLAARPPTVGEHVETSSELDGGAYTEEDEAQIVSRLTDLGYM